MPTVWLLEIAHAISVGVQPSAQDCKHGSGLTEPEAGANRKNQIDNQRENQTFQLIKSFIRCFAQ